MITKKEWKLKALRFILSARDLEDSEIRIDREYAKYVKRFFFGSGEWFDYQGGTFSFRWERRQLPLSLNQYFLR